MRIHRKRHVHGLENPYGKSQYDSSKMGKFSPVLKSARMVGDPNTDDRIQFEINAIPSEAIR